MKEKTYGVLIVDVMGSSQTRRLRSALSLKIRRLSRIHTMRKLISLPYAVTAGDEFQALTSNLHSIPSLILELRVGFRPLALWVGVGIGGISGRVVAPVNRLTGEAFVLAREALESVKKAKTHPFPVFTAFRTLQRNFDVIANSIYGLHDMLVAGISSKQWKTIGTYLNERRVDRTAEVLGLNESTVSRNLKRGFYRQMDENVRNMQEIMRMYFP
jgi:hypothetical protein